MFEGLDLPAMKIARVRAYSLRGALREWFGWSMHWTNARAATLVELTTDAGLTGWGEGGFGGERLRANPELAIGRSPFEMEGIWDDLRPPAGAGLDTALWDVAGKALGKPVWSLLGQRHSPRVTPYCTCLYRKDWPDFAGELAAEAHGWVEKGFRTLKMKTGYGPETDVAIVRAVRAAIGDDIGLAVDSNCAYDDGTALALGRQLEEFNLLWWEEPIPADDVAGYDRLRGRLRIPLASGETMPADWLLRHYIQPRRVHIVQPDAGIVGLTGGRRITELCALAGVRLMPHNWGTHLRTAAGLHWMSCCPEIAGWPPMLEFDQTENPLREAVIREKITVGADGRMAAPEGAGLGVTVVREAVEEYCVERVAIPAD